MGDNGRHLFDKFLRIIFIFFQSSTPFQNIDDGFTSEIGLVLKVGDKVWKLIFHGIKDTDTFNRSIRMHTPTVDFSFGFPIDKSCLSYDKFGFYLFCANINELVGVKFDSESGFVFYSFP